MFILFIIRQWLNIKINKEKSRARIWEGQWSWQFMIPTKMMKKRNMVWIRNDEVLFEGIYIPFTLMSVHAHRCKSKLMTFWSMDPLKCKYCGNKPMWVCLVEIDRFLPQGMFLYLTSLVGLKIHPNHISIHKAKSGRKTKSKYLFYIKIAFYFFF